MHSLARCLTPLSAALLVLLVAACSDPAAPFLAKRATDPLACAYALADSLGEDAGRRQHLFETVLRAYGSSLDVQEASSALRAAERSTPLAEPGQLERAVWYGRVDGLLLSGRRRSVEALLRASGGVLPCGYALCGLDTAAVGRGDDEGRAVLSQFFVEPHVSPYARLFLMKRHARAREWQRAVEFARTIARPGVRSQAVHDLADELERATRWDDTPPQVTPSMVRPLIDDTEVEEDERRRLLRATGVEIPRVPPIVQPPANTGTTERLLARHPSGGAQPGRARGLGSRPLGRGGILP